MSINHNTTGKYVEVIPSTIVDQDCLFIADCDEYARAIPIELPCRIDIMTEDGRIKNITECSEIIEGLALINSKSEHKIFYAEDLVDKIQDKQLKNNIKTILSKG